MFLCEKLAVACIYSPTREHTLTIEVHVVAFAVIGAEVMCGGEVEVGIGKRPHHRVMMIRGTAVVVRATGVHDTWTELTASAAVMMAARSRAAVLLVR